MTDSGSVGLNGREDQEVWRFAKANGYAVISKDADYQVRSARYGAPPKVILLRSGNCSILVVEQMLRAAYSRISAFLQDEGAGCLILERAGLLRPQLVRDRASAKSSIDSGIELKDKQ